MDPKWLSIPEIGRFFKKIKEKRMRQSEIEMAELKAGKIPIAFKISGLTVLGAIIVIIAIIISIRLGEKYWIPAILTFQLLIIVFQLWFIKVQTRFFRIGQLPEFILDAKNVSGGATWKAIWVKNLGATAHRVTFRIKSTKGESLQFSEINRQLYSIRKDQEKLACEININDFIDKKLRIELKYLNKVGELGYANFLKLPGELDFITILSGLE